MPICEKNSLLVYVTSLKCMTLYLSRNRNRECLCDNLDPPDEFPCIGDEIDSDECSIEGGLYNVVPVRTL